MVERDERVCFRLSPEYRSSHRRPVLGQRFEDDLEKARYGRRRGALPDFFANVVPEEGALRRVLIQAMAIEEPDDVDVLAFVGRDLPGAVTVHSSSRETEGYPPWPAQLAPSESEKTENETGLLRFSLAGVQLKFSMLRQEDSLTLPAADRDGRWIVKFPSPTFPCLPENEYAILTWARDAGFDVPDIELMGQDRLPSSLRKFVPESELLLVISRYDRFEEGRVHQEDLAQAVGLPPEKKYEHLSYEAIASLIRRFIDENAVFELVRRLVFVIASGNGDAHLKNWSLIYPDRVRAKWSPLYDQVATVAWSVPERKLALKLAGIRDFHRLDREALRRFAERADLAPALVEEVAEATLTALGRCRESTLENLPPTHGTALREHWENVPLLRELGFQGKG